MALTGVKMWNKLTSTIHPLQSGNMDRERIRSHYPIHPRILCEDRRSRDDDTSFISEIVDMEERVYYFYFNELLGKLREVLTETSVKETFDPATANFGITWCYKKKKMSRLQKISRHQINDYRDRLTLPNWMKFWSVW